MKRREFLSYGAATLAPSIGKPAYAEQILIPDLIEP